MIDEKGFLKSIIEGLSFTSDVESKWFDFYMDLFQCINSEEVKTQVLKIINERRSKKGYIEIILI